MVPLTNEAATMAETLKVLRLLAFPVDALKFPKVAMVESPTQSISGGTSNLSVALIVALRRRAASSVSDHWPCPVILGSMISSSMILLLLLIFGHTDG